MATASAISDSVRVRKSRGLTNLLRRISCLPANIKSKVHLTNRHLKMATASAISDSVRVGNSQSLTKHKACPDEKMASKFIKADRENRFSFEAFDTLLQALQGRRCCSHCVLLNKLRLGTLMKDSVLIAEKKHPQ